MNIILLVLLTMGLSFAEDDGGGYVDEYEVVRFCELVCTELEETKKCKNYVLDCRWDGETMSWCSTDYLSQVMWIWVCAEIEDEIKKT